jgi:exodeoxyribonuclease VII small subunit
MSNATESLTFEQALERLDAVVRDLESSETGLDRSLERYEEGVQLLKRCRAILDEAERKIRLLTGVDAQGNPITQEFDSTSTVERDGAAGREPAARGGRSTGKGSRRSAAEPADDGEHLF